MSSSPEEIRGAVDRYFAAFNAHDAAAVRAAFASDGELRDWDVHKKGASDVEAGVAAIFSAVPAIKCHVLAVHVAPASSTAVAELRIDLDDEGKEHILVAGACVRQAGLRGGGGEGHLRVRVFAERGCGGGLHSA
jgi:ketosteroid isomerase-like protein